MKGSDFPIRVHFYLKTARNVPLDISCPDANASHRVVLVSFFETGAKSAWRCVSRHLPPSQPEPLIFCMTSESRNTSFVIQCCKEDFCNRDLKPPLHPRNKEGTVQTDLEVTKTLQVARAFAAILLSQPLSFLSFFSPFSLIILSLQYDLYINIFSHYFSLFQNFYNCSLLSIYAVLYNARNESSALLESTIHDNYTLIIKTFNYFAIVYLIFCKNIKWTKNKLKLTRIEMKHNCVHSTRELFPSLKSVWPNPCNYLKG